MSVSTRLPSLPNNYFYLQHCLPCPRYSCFLNYIFCPKLYSLPHYQSPACFLFSVPFNLLCILILFQNASGQLGFRCYWDRSTAGIKIIGTEIQLALQLLGQKYSWHCNCWDRSTAGTNIIGTEIQLAL